MLPANVKHLMNEYIRELQAFEDLIEGVYLYGSLALGAYDAHRSDIDFMTVLSRSVTVQEEKDLKNIHKRLRSISGGEQLDGAYIAIADLGKTNDQLAPYPYCHEGKCRVGHWDVNHVTWWMLNVHGITIAGRPVEELPIQVDWSDVTRAMQYHVEEYWDSKKLYHYIHEDGALFALETNARILCTVKEKQIVPKTEAPERAKKWLDPIWHDLMDEAIHLRRSEKKHLYASSLMRAQETKNFVGVVRALCRPYFVV